MTLPKASTPKVEALIFLRKNSHHLSMQPSLQETFLNFSMNKHYLEILLKH